MRWFFRKRTEIQPWDVWMAPKKAKKQKRFHFGNFDAFVEQRHGSACLFVTEAGENDPLCAVPLMQDRRNSGGSIVLTAGPENMLGVRVDGLPAVMVDPKNRLVMSRLGAAFGSPAWGRDVYSPWSRTLENALFDL